VENETVENREVPEFTEEKREACIALVNNFGQITAQVADGDWLFVATVGASFAAAAVAQGYFNQRLADDADPVRVANVTEEVSRMFQELLQTTIEEIERLSAEKRLTDAAADY